MSVFYFGPKVNPIAVTYLLLKALNVKVSDTTIQNALNDHPEFPSLLSISDCLTSWNVANEAYRIEKTDYRSSEFTFPFIAHCNLSGGSFMLVHEIRDGKLIYSDEKSRKAIIDESNFLKIWSGVVLSARSNEKSGEKNYFSNQLSAVVGVVKTPLLIGMVLTIMLFNINYDTLSLALSALLLTKLIGVIVSVLLLMHSINANNPFLQNLCSLGSKNDCNAILKSDAAKITPWLSWSEVGYVYFTGSFLCLLIDSICLPLMAWLNLFALPYIVYSITYQYRKGKWCTLCCMVQALLTLELLSFLNIQQFQLVNVLQLKTMLLAATCFLLPILVWAVLKPILLKIGQVQPLKEQLKKFKYNSELFNQLLTGQARYAIPDELNPVVLGNVNAHTAITIVSNPYCGPCAKAHQLIDKWLEENDDIRINTIFATRNNESDRSSKVAKHLIALDQQKDKKLLSHAMGDWYKKDKSDFEVFAKKYPAKAAPEEIIQRHTDWVKMVDITFTPTILVNGYKLPDPYQLEDIKYLLS